MTIAESLLDSIDSKALRVNTDSFDISFGEISSMYSGGELEIRPAYQRLFRWTKTQQSQLIESLLLGLPIPPIFVIETETRKYELIDGLQRISSYLHFMGDLKSKRYPDGDKLELRDCEIVPELNGLNVDDLSPGLRIKVKRSYVKMYIIKKESPPRIKYDMFKRLNTGGSLLEAQEIRNSTIRFLGEDFIKLIQDLSKDVNFVECTKYVTDYQRDRQYDDELVLRFFTIKNADLRQYRRENEGDTLAYFMTKYAEDVSSGDISFDYEKETKVFQKTFLIINKCLGKNAFSKLNNQNIFTKQFLAFHYEAISVAMSQLIHLIDIDNTTQLDRLKNQFSSLKKDENFADVTQNKDHKATSGGQYLKYLEQRIEIAKNFFSDL
ncbi:MAG: DUF262 domain-containing protein [Microscillaceae bacterium]|nr:DUF262 domain-containing protein [Microscillaceae bacterium]